MVPTPGRIRDDHTSAHRPESDALPREARSLAVTIDRALASAVCGRSGNVISHLVSGGRLRLHRRLIRFMIVLQVLGQRPRNAGCPQHRLPGVPSAPAPGMAPSHRLCRWTRFAEGAFVTTRAAWGIRHASGRPPEPRRLADLGPVALGRTSGQAELLRELHHGTFGLAAPERLVGDYQDEDDAGADE